MQKLHSDLYAIYFPFRFHLLHSLKTIKMNKQEIANVMKIYELDYYTLYPELMKEYKKREVNEM